MRETSCVVLSEEIVERHRQSFREEAREIVRELESCLLELNNRPDDSELIGSVFRCMHTIKGSGAMFGFDELASFTHHLETTYDGVRKGSLKVNSDLVDLSLASLDLIELMVDDPADQAGAHIIATMEIIERLKAFSTGSEQTLVGEHAQASTDPALHGQETKCCWSISFAPGPDLLRNGSNPLLLLRELARLGSLEVYADDSCLPPLAELDVERCYLRWSLSSRVMHLSRQYGMFSSLSKDVAI